MRQSLAACVAFAAFGVAQATAKQCIDSPGKVLEVCISTSGGGAFYEVRRAGRTILERAALGIVFAGEKVPQVGRIVGSERHSHDETWEQPWGEQRFIRDRHNELRVKLHGDTPNSDAFDVVIRAFDDGFAFRYDYHGIGPGKPIQITDELTQFRPAGEYRAWWYEAYHKERDEYLYHSSALNEVTRAETPFTLESPQLYFAIHEAALVDYASMTLARTGPNTLKADLMPWSDGVKVRRTGPFITPWRMVLVGRTPGELVDSRIELNLNEPNKLGDVSWLKPAKFVGVWWEMHINRSTWGSGERHGATTQNVERYIDFAAQYGFNGVLVEGWNTGWDGDWIAHGDEFSYTRTYPDFDLTAIANYARDKGVQLIGHHETAGAVTNYEAQMEDAFALYREHGVRVVKTGYVRPNGTIVRPSADGAINHEWFAGQYMVRHHQHVVETAARYKIALDVHEPVKDTGLRRTYPNMMTREGARGQEYNAWGDPTNPPEHVVILPFTRLLGGPMDFTPGIFDVAHGKTDVAKRVQSTLANQLALYVVIYSPLHMAADLPENYLRHLDAFQFIRDVPTDWERSRTLSAQIGDYIVVARQQRNGPDWYLGALTDEQARKLDVSLDFLTPGKRYLAQLYQDAPDADYRTNPLAYEITERTVTAADRLALALAPGGGTAIRFKALD
jgi:alpha-glucosidase